jgi:tetratricopeptide (TPR) repeat protein
MSSSAGRRAHTLLNKQRYHDAAQAFARELKHAPATADLLLGYGKALRGTGNIKGAIAQFQAALHLAPSEAAYLALAETCYFAGARHDARQALDSALALANGAARTAQACAQAALDGDDLDQAAKILHAALKNVPEDGGCLTLFGIMAMRQGYAEASLTALRKAAESMPQDYGTRCKLAQALHDAELPGAAVPVYQAVLKETPDVLNLQAGLASSLIGVNRPQEAIEVLRRAQAKHKNVTHLIALMAAASRMAGDFATAEACCRQGFGLDPRDLGIRLQAIELTYTLGHYESALRQTQVLAKEFPDDRRIERLEGQLRLALGDFAEGWRKWEARLKVDVSVAAVTTAPRWRGETLDGKRLLIVAEEGFGDAIHFIRYARELAGRGAKVAVYAPPPLVPLLRHASGVSEVFTVRPAQEKLDFHIPMLSLAYALGTRADTIPAHVPYIDPDAADVAAWRQRLNALSPAASMRVGLVWAGNPYHRNDHNRSIPWDEIAPLLDVPNVKFFSLLLGPAREAMQREPRGVVDLADFLTDYYETAGAVSALDLVICVDTSVAHLAGALGKRAFLLLPVHFDWRWQAAREDSPWYPSFRIFRQKTPKDWPEVITRVAAALREAATA